MPDDFTPAPIERLEAAIVNLKSGRWLAALRALRVIREAAGDVLLELVEDWGATEEEAIESIAAALDEAFKIDGGADAGPVLRFLEAKDHDFWRGRLTRWVAKATARQAAAT
jgi:hypothetical protein